MTRWGRGPFGFSVDGLRTGPGRTGRVGTGDAKVYCCRGGPSISLRANAKARIRGSGVLGAGNDGLGVGNTGWGNGNVGRGLMVEEVVADSLAGWLEKKVGAIAPALQEAAEVLTAEFVALVFFQLGPLAVLVAD